MRTFESGATRDDAGDKPNYADGRSSQTERYYLEYLGRHRKTADGLRDWNNWKWGIPVNAYRDSLMRHCEDAVAASRGLPTREDTALEDLLCAIRFNATGWLFELLVAESKNRELVDHPMWRDDETIVS